MRDRIQSNFSSKSKFSSRSIKSKASGAIIAAAKEKRATPAVGCITEVDDEYLSKYPLLPPYVLLHEPSQDEIWAKEKMRAIFLNQPLQQWEQDAMTEFAELLREEFGLKPDEDLPRWLLPHMTRLLQQCKYKPENAVKLYRPLLIERVERLPMSFGNVQDAMKRGFVYWHGRDVHCRPLLTIRIGRVIDLIGRTEDIQRLFCFTMEYAVRYLLVPGRVECWSVIIDCDGVSKLPSLMKCKTFGQAIATTLGKVYSGRMAWTKIFNFPNSWSYTALKKIVQGIVSALGKSDKVAFVAPGETASALAGQVEMGQLERWAGGSAPDLQPEDVFPFRMFADPKGYDAGSVAIDTDLQRKTDLEFHEGLIWADCLSKQTCWKVQAAALPLPPGAAEAVGVKPCRQLDAWRTIMDERRSPKDVSLADVKVQMDKAEDALKVSDDAAPKPKEESADTTYETKESDVTYKELLPDASPEVLLPKATDQRLLPGGQLEGNVPLLAATVLEEEKITIKAASRDQVETKTVKPSPCMFFCCSASTS